MGWMGGYMGKERFCVTRKVLFEADLGIGNGRSEAVVHEAAKLDRKGLALKARIWQMTMGGGSNARLRRRRTHFKSDVFPRGLTAKINFLSCLRA